MKKICMILLLFLMLAVVSCEKVDKPYIPTVDEMENTQVTETDIVEVDPRDDSTSNTTPSETTVRETTQVKETTHSYYSDIEENGIGPNLKYARRQPDGVKTKDLYDFTSYDGVYTYLVDNLYRIKQGIIKLEKKKISTRLYEKYEEMIDEFLADKSINYLLSNSFLHDETGVWYINTGWADEFYILLQFDSERLLADERLVDLFRLDIQCGNAYGHILPQEDRLKEIEQLNLQLFDVVNPGTAVVTGVSYDSETMRIVVNIDIGNAERYVYTLGNSEITRFTTNYSLMNKDDMLTLPVNYEGNIHVACIDENGLQGKPSTYYIEAQTELLPDTACGFECDSLKYALYSYLGLDNDAVISAKSLIGITEIYINGSDIYFNGNGLDESLMNENDGSMVDGLSLEDFDNFPTLESLTILHNDLPELSGERIKYVTTLKLVDCKLSDISYLADNYITNLYLNDNVITDGTSLGTSHCLDLVVLTNNPIKSFALPAREMTKIDVSNTSLENLQWLGNVTNVLELNCSGITISDVSILGDFRKLQYLYLPADVDTSFSPALADLISFYVGDNKIK